jgi:hypothetical protein
MSNLAVAKEAIAKHLKTLEAFQVADDALSTLESIANAQKEADARLAKVGQDAAAAEKRVASLKADETGILAARAADAAQHAQRAQDLVSKAQETAKIIEENAVMSAAKVESDAKANAERIIAKAKEEAISAFDLASRRNEEAAIAVGSVEAARKELAALTAKIEAAKAAISKMLG